MAEKTTTVREQGAMAPEKQLTPELRKQLGEVKQRLEMFVQLITRLRTQFQAPVMAELQAKLLQVPPAPESGYQHNLVELREAVLALEEVTGELTLVDLEQLRTVSESLQVFQIMIGHIEHDGQLHGVYAEVTHQAERMQHYESVFTVLRYFADNLDKVDGLISRLNSATDTHPESEVFKKHQLTELAEARATRAGLGERYLTYARIYAEKVGDPELVAQCQAAIERSLEGDNTLLGGLLATLQEKARLGVACYASRPAIRDVVETLPTHLELTTLIAKLEQIALANQPMV